AKTWAEECDLVTSCSGSELLVGCVKLLGGQLSLFTTTSRASSRDALAPRAATAYSFAPPDRGWPLAALLEPSSSLPPLRSVPAVQDGRRCTARHTGCV